MQLSYNIYVLVYNPRVLDISLLGGFDLKRNGQPMKVTRIHVQQLLTYLLLNINMAVSRESFAELLWDEGDKASKLLLLRGVLMRLETALGKGYIIRTGKTLAFNVNLPYRCDALDLLAIANADLSKHPVETLIQIAATYKPLLPLMEKDWIVAERARLQTIFEEKLLRNLAERLVTERCWSEALHWGERALTSDSNTLHEPIYRALMLAHYQLGHGAEVSQTYERCKDALMDELGLLPSRETRELYERLLREEEPRHAAPQKATAIYLPDDLLHPPTPFVGRAQLLAQVGRLLADPNAQLITLLGIGGIGKTRLAIQVALSQAALFADGVCLVALDTARTPETFYALLSNAVHFTPYSQENLKAQVLSFLREKSVLIILDNFETLLESAATSDSVIDGPALVEELCVKAPHVKVLVTSRQSLDLRRETLVDVDGLDVPTGIDAPNARTAESVVLFDLIAQRVNQRFDLNRELGAVVQICQLVSGTPLAVEIAAALVRGLTCTQIAERIQSNLDALIALWRDVPPRQRSLRAVLEYAWSLLTLHEQRVFSQLSVFVDGFTNEAAASVAGATYTTLRALLDCALIRQESSGRFQTHSFVRQFGGEKLTQRGEEAETRKRMAAFFLAHAQANSPPERYKGLETEWANLLAGMATVHAQGNHTDVLAYADALSEPWYVYARYGDIRQGLAWATLAAEGLKDEKAQARLLSHWGRACVRQGDYAEADGYFERGLAVAWKLIDSPSIARILYERAQLLIERAELTQADAALDQCIEIYEELNDQVNLGEAFRQKARVYHHIDNNLEAQRLAEHALGILNQTDDEYRLPPIFRLLADIAQELRDFESAQKYCKQALYLSAKNSNEREHALAHYSQAAIYQESNHLDLAVDEAKQSIRMLRALGDRKSTAYVTNLLGYICFGQNDYQGCLAHLSTGLSLLRELNDSMSLIRPLLHLANVYAKLSLHQNATQTYMEGFELAVKFDHPLESDFRKNLGL